MVGPIVALARVVGTHLGLEALKAAGRGLARRYGERDGGAAGADVTERLRLLEAETEAMRREIVRLSSSLVETSERVGRLLAGVVLALVGSFLVGVLAIVVALVV